MPVICALVPEYKVAFARLAQPALRGRPVIVVDRLDRGHVLALDERAYALGARRGMTLVQAAACAREAAVAIDDPRGGRTVWERALDALDAASPLVEDVAPGTALLEMRGIEGSELVWLESVRAAFHCDVELRALPLRIALGSSPFVARIAARVRNDAIVRGGQERAFLAPLSLRYLDLDRDVLERLELLGIRTLGELAALPHGPFVRRFGPAAARWHACASGRDDEPLVPRPRRISIDRALFGDGTAEREDQLLFALRTLVGGVCDDIALLGKRCGALRLELECEDGETHAIEATLAQPTSGSAAMFDLLRARLEGTVLRSPVTGLRLRAARLEEGGTELSLFAGHDPDPEIVAVALARLSAALGSKAVLRARIGAGHRYEARIIYESFAFDAIVRTVHGACADAQPGTQTRGTLAYRVLRPRTVDVRTHHGRPAFVDAHSVLEWVGPWRVDEAWWAKALEDGRLPVAHDAYDVLLDDGVLCRIVKESERWYLGGTYD